MKILVVGSGGREHALAWKIRQSPLVTSLVCAPGNPGMATLGQCEAVAADDITALADLACSMDADLTVVGPEAPMVAGIADLFESRGLPIFAPSRAAAEIEGSKVFARGFMAQARRAFAGPRRVRVTRGSTRIRRTEPLGLPPGGEGRWPGRGQGSHHCPDDGRGPRSGPWPDVR